MTDQDSTVTTQEPDSKHEEFKDEDELSLSEAMAKVISTGKRVLECMVCNKLLKKPLYCTKCKLVIYCGKDCQTKDYETHKRMCRPCSFGIYDDQKYNLIGVHSDKNETFFVATTDIQPYVTLLSDKPVFFFTNDDWRKLGEEARKRFMGNYEKLFHYISEDDEKYTLSHECCLIQEISKMAAWISVEGGLRLKWKGVKDPLSDSFADIYLSQTELDLLHFNYELLTPLDYYIIAKNLAPSLTTVYSRTCFNELGKGLFENAWRLSYSCSPNSVVYISEGELKVLSVRAIKKGDKITIGYHPSVVLKPLSARRNLLFGRFGIKSCHCSRCIAEAAGEIKTKQGDSELWEIVNKSLNVFKNTGSQTPKSDGEADKPNGEGDFDVSNLKCSDPRIVENALKVLLSDAKTVAENRLTLLAVDFNYSTYMMDLLQEIDAGRAPTEHASKYISSIKNMLTQILSLRPNNVDPIEQKLFASLYLDRQLHDFIFLVKVDAMNVLNAILGRHDKSKLEFIPRGHYDSLPTAQKFAEITVKLFSKPYIYTEFFMAGLEKDEVDRSVSYYLKGGKIDEDW